MATQHREILISEEGRNTIQRCRMALSETVDAMDTLTRALIRVKVADLSVYRHTLQRNGKFFRIHNILDSVYSEIR